MDATLRVVTRQGEKRFWGSAITFILALLSKEFAIITPGLMALISFVNLTNGKFTKLPVSAKRDSSKDTKESPYYVHNCRYLYPPPSHLSLNFQNTLNFYGVDMTKVDQSQPLTRYATSFAGPANDISKSLTNLRRNFSLAKRSAYGKNCRNPDNITRPNNAFLVNCNYNNYNSFLFILYQGPLIIPLAIGWFFISILPVSA